MASGGDDRALVDTNGPASSAHHRTILGDIPEDFLRLTVEERVPRSVAEQRNVPPALQPGAPMQGMLRVTVMQVQP